MDRFHHSHNAAASSQLTRPRSSPFNSVLFILIALVLGVVFAYFGSEVAEGDSQAFDLLVVQYAKELRTNHLWLAEVLRDLSGVGSTVVLTLLTLSLIHI